MFVILLVKLVADKPTRNVNVVVEVKLVVYLLNGVCRLITLITLAECSIHLGSLINLHGDLSSENFHLLDFFFRN